MATDDFEIDLDFIRPIGQLIFENIPDSESASFDEEDVTAIALPSIVAIGPASLVLEECSQISCGCLLSSLANSIVFDGDPTSRDMVQRRPLFEDECHCVQLLQVRQPMVSE